MKVEFLHVGFDNVIAANRVVAIVGPSSAPIKRLINAASKEGRVLDMTNGRKTKAVIILDDGHIALVALQPETITGRLNAKNGTQDVGSEIRDTGSGIRDT